MESGVDTWVRDSGMPFMNLRGMFWAHFVLLSLAMLEHWAPSAYLFYNALFMFLLILGIVNKEKPEHLELALAIDGASVILDIIVITACYPADAVGKFSAALAVFNLILRFISFLVLRNEVATRVGDGRLIGNSTFGGQYQDIDGGDR